jgi:sulfide dehydrogenase cytochrome subunit
LFLLASVVAAGATHGAAPPSMLANACAGCHGTNGLSTTPMPIIAGLNQEYLATILKQYKEDERPSTIMGRLAKGYTDKELELLATFFASQDWISPRQPVADRLVREGARLAEEQCTMCHRDGGRYMDASMPRLAGQWRRYLEIAMEEYKDPARDMPSDEMEAIMAGVSQDEISALAHFFASQK